MSASSLTWTVQQTTVPAASDTANLAGYRLEMVVTTAVNLTTKVFIFQRGPITPGATIEEDTFYSIASVADMAAIAADTPNEGSSFYRTDSLGLVFGSLEELDESRKQIEQLFIYLCDANDIANLLTAPATHHYP